jgi:hypothetical protein
VFLQARRRRRGPQKLATVDPRRQARAIRTSRPKSQQPAQVVEAADLQLLFEGDGRRPCSTGEARSQVEGLKVLRLVPIVVDNTTISLLGATFFGPFASVGKRRHPNCCCCRHRNTRGPASLRSAAPLVRMMPVGCEVVGRPGRQGPIHGHRPYYLGRVRAYPGNKARCDHRDLRL